MGKDELYALCRAGTDPAVTRFLEEERNPLLKMRRKLGNITMNGLEEKVVEAWEEHDSTSTK
jgi:hypothetical protein